MLTPGSIDYNGIVPKPRKAEQPQPPTAPPHRGFPEHTYWKAGQSGNPSGRPRAILSDGLRRYLGDNPAEYEAILRTIVKKAIAGEYAFIALLFDRLEGRPVQRLETADVSEQLDLSAATDAELRRILLQAREVRAAAKRPPTEGAATTGVVIPPPGDTEE